MPKSDLVCISFKVQPNYRDLIKTAAKRRNQSASGFIRASVEKEIKQVFGELKTKNE